jgi:hypothetical protein
MDLPPHSIGFHNHLTLRFKNHFAEYEQRCPLCQAGSAVVHETELKKQKIL